MKMMLMKLTWKLLSKILKHKYIVKFRTLDILFLAITTKTDAPSLGLSAG